jgi:hypothetical protein
MQKQRFTGLLHNLRPPEKPEFKALQKLTSKFVVTKPGRVASRPLVKPVPGRVAPRPLVQPVPVRPSSLLTPVKLPVQRRALCIGINYEGTPYALGGCINDMDNLAAKLTSTGVLSSAAVVRMDDTKKGTGLYPTRVNIMAQLQALRTWAQSHPAGTQVDIIVAYSGHGSFTRDTSGDEADQRDEVIVPVDFSYIRDDEIRAYLASFPSNVFVFFMVDACYSGTVCDLRYSYQLGAGNRLQQATSVKYAETVAKCVSFTAATDTQTAVDAVLPDPVTSQAERQGALMNAFCTFFVPGVRMSTLLAQIRERIRQRRFNQITQLSAGKPLPQDATLF